MSFCKYCGKKLEDGKICTCSKTLSSLRDILSPSGGIEGTLDCGFPDGLSAAAQKDGEHTAPEHNVRLGLIVMGAAALAIILLIICAASSLGRSWTSPVRELEKGLRKADAERIISVVLSEGQTEELAYIADVLLDEDMDDVTADLSNMISELRDAAESDYFGGDLKITIEVLKTSKPGKNIESQIRSLYKTYDEKVIGIRRLRVTVTVSGDDNEESCDLNIYSVKLSGDQRVLFPDSRSRDILYAAFGSLNRSLANDIERITSSNYSYSELFT